MADRIQIRRDTAANWASVNPVLAQGEMGLETDTEQMKLGDGTTAYNALNYFVTSQTNVGITGGTIDDTVIGGSTAAAGSFTTLELGGTGITATATELNVLDGITATTAELNVLEGVTATTAELNILDGVTATTAELNYTDGVTSNIQTQLNTKAPIDDATFTGTTTIPTADINGGTIDGTVIGGTTAAAGTFTTLTASGDVNFDSGTLFVDESENRVGVGVTSPLSKLDVVQSNDTVFDKTLTDGQRTEGASLRIWNPSTVENSFSQIVFQHRDTGQGISRIVSLSSASGNDSALVFVTEDSNSLGERIRIANNGDISFYEDTGTTAKLFWDASAESLGIGTSSPTNKLKVLGGNGNQLSLDNTGQRFTQIDFNNNAVVKGRVWFDNSGDLFAMQSNSNIVMYSGGINERMRIDSSGNVGIGTSSFNSSNKVQVNLATNTVTTGSPVDSSIFNIQGGTTTVGDGVSLQLSNFSGAKETGWRISAVTTSGNNGDLVINGYAGGADYPEALRITSAGNVGIGTSSPDAKLEVNGNIYTTSNTNFLLFGTNPAVNPYIQGNVNNGLSIGTGNLPRISIDSSGNVGIGTSSPIDNLTVSGTNPALGILADSTTGQSDLFFRDAGGASGRIRYLHTDDAMTFFTVGAERMRIDSSGNVLVGTTASPSGSNQIVSENGFFSALAVSYGRRARMIYESARFTSTTGSEYIELNVGINFAGSLNVIANNAGSGGNRVKLRSYMATGNETTTFNLDLVSETDGLVDSLSPTFTITVPTSGVIRLTNTKSGQAVHTPEVVEAYQASQETM